MGNLAPLRVSYRSDVVISCRVYMKGHFMPADVRQINNFVMVLYHVNEYRATRKLEWTRTEMKVAPAACKHPLVLRIGLGLLMSLTARSL